MCIYFNFIFEELLRSLEMERAERIKAKDEDTPPPPPAQRGQVGQLAGVPLRQAQGAQWRNSALFSRLRRGDGSVQ